MSFLHPFFHGLNILFHLHSQLKYVSSDFKLLKTIIVLAYSYLHTIGKISFYQPLHRKNNSPQKVRDSLRSIGF